MGIMSLISEIVAALESSFAFDHKAIGTLATANAFEGVGGSSTRSTQAAMIAVHSSDRRGRTGRSPVFIQDETCGPQKLPG